MEMRDIAAERRDSGERLTTKRPWNEASAATMSEIGWTATKMRAGTPITIKEDLIRAYQAASSLQFIRALR